MKPTWQNALASSFGQGLALSKSQALNVEVVETTSAQSMEPRLQALETGLQALEDNADELKCKFAEHAQKHQAYPHFLLIFVELRFAFYTEQGIAKLLRCCSVADAAALAGCEAKALHARMERENKKQAFVERVPDVATVESWIQAAKLAAE